MSGSRASFRTKFPCRSHGSRRNRPQHGVACPMFRRARVMALLAVALLGLVPAADAAAPTLAQITARLRTASQYDDARGKGLARPAPGDRQQRSRRLRRPSASCASRCSPAPPPDAPRATAAPRLRSRLKLTGTMIVALPDERPGRLAERVGRAARQVRAAVVGKGGPSGARLAIKALLRGAQAAGDHDADHDHAGDDAGPRRRRAAASSGSGSTSRSRSSSSR